MSTQLNHPKQRYRQAIAGYLDTDPDNVSLFWKGRVALYGILKSLGIREGDEVIMPGFTCVVVPNAVIYFGAKPVYVDINPETFTMVPEEVERKITPLTKVIIAQNTFGLSADMDALLEIGKRRGVKVIEDCTHGIGGMYKGRKNGTLAEAAFFSTQWNKPYSTGLGGFAIVNKSLVDSMKAFETSCSNPSWPEIQLLRGLLFARNKTRNSSAYWSLLHLYRRLSRLKGFAGSSDPGELSGTEIPNGYLKGISNLQCEIGINGIEHLNEYVVHQCEIASQYSKELTSLNIPLPVEPSGYLHTYLKYPIRVSQRDLFLELAEQKKIELGDWFLSPLHPVKSSFEKWNYQPGSCPVAELVASQMVNLPTHAGISSRDVARILTFIRENQEYLIRPKPSK